MKVPKSASVFGLVLFSMATLGAQNIDIAQIVEGNKLTQKYLPTNWPPDLRPIRLTYVGDFNLNPFVAGSVLEWGEEGEMAGAAKHVAVFTDALAAVWTKGEKIVVEEHQFLVTYRLNVPVAAAVERPAFRRWKRDHEIVLQLCLVRTDTISKIEPLEITIADLRESLQAIESLARRGDAGVGALDAPFISGTPDALLYSLPILARAIQQYPLHFDGLFPRAASILELKTKIRPYLTAEQLQHWKTKNPNGGEFSYNSSLGGLVANEINHPWKVPMLYETNAWPDGQRAVLFVDGQCRLLSQEEWKTTLNFMKATTTSK